jgi:hypothetical protein
MPVQLPAASPEPAAGASLDDYFDRLDAAFATLGNAQAAPQDATTFDSGDAFGRDVPTIDDVLAGASLRTTPGAPTSAFGHMSAPPAEPPDAAATISPSPRPRSADVNGDRHAIVDVFNLLFAVEQGEADPASIRIAPAAGSPGVTDDLVDEVTRRVLERLAPEATRDVVAEIVSEVAERLVREEINRVRSRQ